MLQCDCHTSQVINAKKKWTLEVSLLPPATLCQPTGQRTFPQRREKPQQETTCVPVFEEDDKMENLGKLIFACTVDPSCS